MTDRSDSELPADQAPTEKKPEERELRGRYVEGTYGKAGVQRGRRAEDEEGQYVQGDYGAAGSEGGLPEPLGDRAKESGRYVEADYGDAGAAPGRTAGSEIGQYTAGDYGADGTVDPLRKAGTGTSNDEPMAESPHVDQEADSGGAQSVGGARGSDLPVAGEPPAAGKPFDTGTKEE